MQKSKKATIGIIILMFLYGLFTYSNWVKQNNFIYLYVINPVFWLSLACILKYGFGKTYDKSKNKKEIIQYCSIGVLIYIITYMVSGLFITFGKNPYSTTASGVLTNLWILAVAIVSKEYIRYKLVQNVYEKEKIKVAVVISIIYIFIDFNISRFFYGQITVFYIVKQIAQNLIPLIGKNILYSYISINSGYIPSIIYELGTKLYLWMSPILPNSPWVMVAIIDGVIPVIICVYIRYVNTKKDIFKSRDRINSTNPKSIIPLVIGIILAIWFATGVFPIKPVAIASGSMEKELFVGDVAVVKKCNSNDVVVGDIIEYQMEGYTVIHRIIEKRQRNGQFYFVTKGDNNKLPDAEEVKEGQLIGKIIFKVRYVGYPAIWLHIIQTDEANIKVET
ncbi:MAG: signal peptidase I [Clostridiaceae bacterium]|nr:signal peptidase I [Clostridiaceae bacterium]